MRNAKGCLLLALKTLSWRLNNKTMKVIDILHQAKKPLFTFEIVPPLKGTTVEALFSTVESLLPYEPAYINITNHQSEVVYLDRGDGLLQRCTIHKRPGTVALSALIQYKYNIPVVSHLICGGHTSEEIENSLVELNFLGIDNVLALRGDALNDQKRFVPTIGGWEHSNQLVSQIEALNHGTYLEETVKDPAPTNFCIGVAGYPEKHAEATNMEADIAHLKCKVDSGASYIVTQLFFDNQVYYNFVEACRKAGIIVPIIPGIKPLGSKRDIQTIPQTFHVDIPKELEALALKAQTSLELKEVGVYWATAQTKDLLKHGVPGVHYYTLGKAESVGKIVRASF